jgi:Spy/CpxP family protein refolding chaperone
MMMSTSGSPGWTLTLYILAVTFHPLFKEFRIMKTFLMCSALALAVVLGGATAYAQMGGPGGGNGQHQPMSPEQRMKMLTQQLKLTNDQQQNIKLILEDESNQMESLRSNTSLTQQERRSKMQEIRQNTKAQMNSILTQEQQTQLQQAESQQTTVQRDGARPKTPQPQ